MASLKKYDISGKELEVIQIDNNLLTQSVNPQLIKDYLVAIRNNARQWSASTKGRSEIAHSNKKPHPQKGTGRARQGCIVVSQYRGGAVVFGPKPKFDQHVKINKKEKRAAIRFLLAQKISSGNIHVLQVASMETPKTSIVSNFLKSTSLDGRRILFVGDSSEETKSNCANFVKSTRNICKTSFMPISSISGYDVIRNQEIIVMDTALEQLITTLGNVKTS